MGGIEVTSGPFYEQGSVRSVWVGGNHGDAVLLFSWVLKILSLLRITGARMDHGDVPEDNFENPVRSS